jgi:hypothetical protein
MTHCLVVNSTQLHINPEPPAAQCHKKGSQVLKLTTLEEWEADRDEYIASKDGSPTLKALLRLLSRKEAFIEEPRKSANALLIADQHRQD